MTDAQKIIFLDIDGVVNSRRTCYAYGQLPHNACDKFFDDTALGMLRTLCSQTNAAIVLSSSWRYSHSHYDLGNELKLPIVDATIMHPTSIVPRGEEIQEWLNRHPGVTQYVIVDDNSDMLPSQLDNFVQTSFDDGLLFRDVTKMKNILLKDA